MPDPLGPATWTCSPRPHREVHVLEHHAAGGMPDRAPQVDGPAPSSRTGIELDLPTEGARHLQGLGSHRGPVDPVVELVDAVGELLLGLGLGEPATRLTQVRLVRVRPTGCAPGSFGPGPLVAYLGTGPLQPAHLTSGTLVRLSGRGVLVGPHRSRGRVRPRVQLRPSPVDAQRLGGHRVQQRAVVADHETEPAERPQRVDEQLAGVGVEVVGGLVEQQHVRAASASTSCGTTTGGTSATTWHDPAVGVSSPATSRSSVVLPPPLGPTTPTHPTPRSRSTLASTGNPAE